MKELIFGGGGGGGLTITTAGLFLAFTAVSGSPSLEESSTSIFAYLESL